MGKRRPGDNTVKVAGALVDSRAEDRLTAAVEAQTVEMIQHRLYRKDWLDAVHKHARMIEDNTEEMHELRAEMRALGNVIATSHRR